jgi:hypothetical protein
MAEGGEQSETVPADGPAADGATADGPVPAEGATQRSGKVVFMEALRVKRNAKIGAAVGLLFAAFVFVSFPGAYAPSRSTAWYVALAFVLMFSMAGLVAFFLTLGRAVRLSRDL